jgi:hypothetical protein
MYALARWGGLVPRQPTLEPQPRSFPRLALLSACVLLALAGAGCGSSDKISSVSDPTSASTPNPTTKFSASGGFVSVGGKGGKGHNGNGANDSGGGGNGGGGGGNGGGGGGNGGGGGGHHHNGNGKNGNFTAGGGFDANPKTSAQPGNVAGAVDCKSNDSGNSGSSGGAGGSSECAATINCTNVHIPGTAGTDCCPFPLPSDEGGHKRKSSNGDCPTAESDQTETKSGKSGKSGGKRKSQ